MKSPKRLMALALAATLMCLPGASLAEDAAATDAPAAIEETTTTVAEDPNEVLATVNGVEITRARFNTFYQSMLSYYGQYYDTTNESLQAAIRQNLLLQGQDRKSTRLNSSHVKRSRMPSSA